MARDNHTGADKSTRGSMSTNPSQKTAPGYGKEEISYELAELGNLKPKAGKMTPNHREESQEEKSY